MAHTNTIQMVTSLECATVTPSKSLNGKEEFNSNGSIEKDQTDTEPDLIMMTPLKKELDHTILRVERLDKNSRKHLEQQTARHIAGGQHQGIIVNKYLAQNENVFRGQFDLRLSFKVYLVNAITQIHQQESRELRFWFDNSIVSNGKEQDRLQCAQSFFRALVNPLDFPKNYVGFIMKLMKIMQKNIFRPLIQIELEVKQIDEPFERPSSSGRSSVDMGSNNLNLQPLTNERVLEMIECAYPNPLSLSEITSSTCSNNDEIVNIVQELCHKGLAKMIDLNQVVRVTSDETQIKRVRQMPEVVRSQQPTIAIITAQFCEKLAVDSMIENKDTYVRYKQEGESNVYTLGNIGPHRVVATKLPAVGNTRSAMIAAGNTTTRLLGTFQHVEYVFLVGIGGGVPHYTDYKKHVRLGDVVVSACPLSSSCSPENDDSSNKYDDFGQEKLKRNDFVYVHCEKLKSSPDEPMNSSNSIWKELQTIESFNYRFWCPLSLSLQDLARKIYEESIQSTEIPPWELYLSEARKKLQETDNLEFSRPNSASDKLYMSIGPNEMIEMAHPELDEEPDDDPRRRGMPKIHFGAVGSGRLAIGNEQLRQDIAHKFGIKAFDIEFDTVIESIFGNRKDRYIIIRGIADYKDGSRKKEWQPYAALSAAAFMKAILCRLEPLH
ncbi:COP9 signalosome complex subunit 5-like [Sarcoptes scabiei]|nr:COP9 signalosome complex subunit 5-like [Sarcoptes scabiei]